MNFIKFLLYKAEINSNRNKLKENLFYHVILQGDERNILLYD